MLHYLHSLQGTSLSFPEILPILSKPAVHSILSISCEGDNYFLHQSDPVATVLAGNSAAAHWFWIYSSWRGCLYLHKLQASQGCQWCGTSRVSARSRGQQNPFHLWIAAYPAPRATVNVVCHIMLQFVQSSHKDLRLLKGQWELLKCPQWPLSAVCLLKQQGKENLMPFKAVCRFGTNKLEDCTQPRAHYGTVWKSYKLLPVWGGEWIKEWNALFQSKAELFF